MLQELAGATCTRATPAARSTSSPRRSCPGAGTLPAALAGARHDRLRLPQRPERHLRRRRAGAAAAPRLRQAHRAQRSRSTTCSTTSKQLIMATAMASELNVLAHMLDRIGEGNRKSRDFTLESLRDVIREVVACFPVYRTYVDESGWTPADRAVVDAGDRARAAPQPGDGGVALRLLPRSRAAARVPRMRPPTARPGSAASATRRPTTSEARERLRFAMKLQQYTGPVQAKGLEDTAFYRYNVLLSVNEVGGDPVADRPVGRGVPRRQRSSRAGLAVRHADHRHPRHQARRGRARAHQRDLGAAGRVGPRGRRRWMRINRTQRRLVDGDPAPDRSDEYRLYQVLLGAWPADLPATPHSAPAEFIDRIAAYMLKAAREAKLHTSWLTTNQAYEDALTGFVERILGPAGGPRFLPAFPPFQRRVAVARRDQLAVAGGAEARLAGRSGLLPGHRAVGPEPGRSRQPPSGRLRPARRSCSTRLETRSDRTPRCCCELARRPDQTVRHHAPGCSCGASCRDVFVGGEYLPLETESHACRATPSHSRGVPASDAVIAVAPRLCRAAWSPTSGPAPLGGECWKTSRVMLPGSAAAPDVPQRVHRRGDPPDGQRPRQGWIFVGASARPAARGTAAGK